MTKDEALKLALEALETSARNWPSDSIIEAITAIKEALVNDALERKAENARELGLTYEPEQEKTVCPFCSSEWVTAEQHDRKVDRLEQEPVVWFCSAKQLVEIKRPTEDDYRFHLGNWEPLYIYPPQRKPLSDDEIALIVAECASSAHRHDDFSFARAIEAAHGIGEKK